MTQAPARAPGKFAPALLAVACVMGAQPNATVQGVELSVTRIERMELWQGGWAPPQHEFLVLHVKVDARHVQDQIALSSFQLLTHDGSRWPSPTRELSLSGGSEHVPELGFAVPKGARPATLMLAGVALDLASLAPP